MTDQPNHLLDGRINGRAASVPGAGLRPVYAAVYGAVTGRRTGVDRAAGGCGRSPHPARRPPCPPPAASYRTTIAIALAGALVAPAASVADDHWAWTSTRPPRPRPRQDLRSPDTRDAALGRRHLERPRRDGRQAAAAGARRRRGIDWGDAGIGAGTLFGVIVVGLGGAMAIVHRRRAAADGACRLTPTPHHRPRGRQLPAPFASRRARRARPRAASARSRCAGCRRRRCGRRAGSARCWPRS